MESRNDTFEELKRILQRRDFRLALDEWKAIVPILERAGPERSRLLRWVFAESFLYAAMSSWKVSTGDARREVRCAS